MATCTGGDRLGAVQVLSMVLAATLAVAMDKALCILKPIHKKGWNSGAAELVEGF
ncbi:MAG TPA: hypothetical protein V6D03_00955 [Candidatus Caenarcaniphilales bacterium]